MHLIIWKVLRLRNLNLTTSLEKRLLQTLKFSKKLFFRTPQCDGFWKLWKLRKWFHITEAYLGLYNGALSGKWKPLTAKSFYSFSQKSPSMIFRWLLNTSVAKPSFHKVFWRRQARFPCLDLQLSQPAFTCSKLTIEAIEQSVKYVER